MNGAQNSKWDLIVVGAGSAGAAFAARRAQRGDQVLLLEAGPDYRSKETAEPWRSPNPLQALLHPEVFDDFVYKDLMSTRTSAQQPSLYWRGRGLGGSSAINGQIAIRPPMEDFDDWEAQGCTGWGRNDVLPYFNRLETDELHGHEEYHGGSGPIPVYRTPQDEWGIVDKALAVAASEQGFPWHDDVNAPGAFGISPYPINSRNNRRVNTNDAYLEPMRDNESLTIRGGSLVDRVLLEGNRAVGVSVVSHGGERIEEYATTIVLSAGAIHTPTILIRSGIGPAETLSRLGVTPVAVLPVGENLQDHAAIDLGIVFADSPNTPTPDDRHTNCTVRYHSNDPDGSPYDLMMFATNHNVLMMESAHVDDKFGGVGVWINAPYSTGTVTVTSLDPAVQPTVDENMLSDPRDLRRLRQAVKQLVTMAQNEAFSSIARLPIEEVNRDVFAAVASNDDDELDRVILAKAGDTQHATSTCRMGAVGDPDAVVDPECNVQGIDGLKVIDASVFPTCPRANTHLATVMVGELMADRIDGVTLTA